MPDCGALDEFCYGRPWGSPESYVWPGWLTRTSTESHVSTVGDSRNSLIDTFAICSSLVVLPMSEYTECFTRLGMRDTVGITATWTVIWISETPFYIRRRRTAWKTAKLNR